MCKVIKQRVGGRDSSGKDISIRAFSAALVRGCSMLRAGRLFHLRWKMIYSAIGVI